MRYLVICLILLTVSTAHAWDGYDYNESEYVEIGSGNLVRTGNDIEVYHYGSGEYRDEEVTNIDSFGNVETYDYNTGEYNEYDMD